MKIKTPSDKFLEKAQRLSTRESERVLSRMTGKLPRKLEKDKLSTVEAIAIQLEIEEAMLIEWRERMTEIREKSKSDVPSEPPASAE